MEPTTTPQPSPDDAPAGPGTADPGTPTGASRLEDLPRTAVVTGAGRGIGRGLALGLAQAGWAVALVGRTEETLVQTARSIEAEGGTAVVVPADVTDAGQVAEAARRIEDGLAAQGGPALLVNNAGVIERQEVPFLDDDVEDVWRVVEVNVRGPLLLTHALLPGMLARGGGRVVNVNSGSAFKPSPHHTGYGISKGALARLTTLLDAQYRDQGLRVFDLSPGVVETDMTQSMPMWDGKTDWTPVETVVELLLGLASGQLDALAGRFVRAGADTVASLSAHTYDVLVHDARRLTLVPYGPDDGVA